MSEPESGLFAIKVDADDYGEAAASDATAVSRTFQSEADFQTTKSQYIAKVDGPGTPYRDLLKAVPVLDGESNVLGPTNGTTKTTLSKKDVQLLGYAVGEMYYEKRYLEITDLCQRIRSRCEMDEKTVESLTRWEKRCREKIGVI